MVHIKGSSFTEHVEVARGHIDTEYFMKHLQASPEQVRSFNSPNMYKCVLILQT